MSHFKSSFEHRKRDSPSSSRVSQKEPHEIMSDQVNIPYSDQSEGESEESENDRDAGRLTEGQLSDAAISPNSQSYRSTTLSYEPKTPDNEDADQTFQSKLQQSSHRSLPSSLHSMDRSYTFGGADSDHNGLLKYHPDLDDSIARNLKGMNIHEKVSDDLLKSLLYEEKVLKERLQTLVILHKEVTSKGSSSQKIRENILICFKSLTLLYQAITELYEKEFQRKSVVFSSLRDWEKSKKGILEKITEIRDPNNGEGRRLKQLIEETDVLDGQIKEIEKRLNQLKEKKRVLNTEIIQSQSIIESRTSSYLDELETIEQTEAKTLRELNNEGLINGEIVTSYNHNNSMFSSLLGKLSNHPNEKRLPDATAVMETIKRQLDSNKDFVSDYQSKEQVYCEGCLIWADTGHLLQNLELELSEIIKKSSRDLNATGTKEKIEKTLRKTLNVLQEREKTFTHISDELRTLLASESETIDSSLRVLSNQPPPISRDASKSPKRDEGFSFSKPQASKPVIASISSPVPTPLIAAIGASSNHKSFGASFKDKLIYNHKNGQRTQTKTKKTD